MVVPSRAVASKVKTTSTLPSFSSAVKVVDAVTGFPFTRIFAPVL